MSDPGALPVQAYLLACLLASGIAFWLARQSWTERDEPGGIEVAFYLACGGGFSLLYALRVASSNATVMSAALQLSTPLLAAIPVLFVLFAFAYTGHDGWRSERWIVALATPAFLWVLFAWTSHTHGLARRSFSPVADGPFTLIELGLGPVGVAFVLYAYALYAVGILAIYELYYRTGNRYRLQTFLALLGTLFPLLAGFATVVDLGSFSHLEWTPVGFVIHGVFLYGTVFWLGTLDASVAARDTAVEVMQDPVVVSGSDGRIRDLNPAAVDLLPSDAIGSSLGDVVPDIDSRGEKPLRIGDRLFDVQIDPITDPRGSDRGYVALFSDVTARERRQAELERRETQLERQNERLEEFAGVVSHDLRNPLAAATAAVELARRTDGTREEALERAADAHERMDDLIEGLLSLATAGKTVDEVEAVSLDAVVRTVWSRLETASATIEVDADVTVYTDRDRLHQLLENLFRNAVEHGGDDVTVRVTAVTDGAGDGVRLRVEDDGPGIPSDDRSRVFERGVSLNEGTGLGLSIVGDIADAHGWTVGLVDGELRGACFQIDGIERVEEADRDGDSGID